MLAAGRGQFIKSGIEGFVGMFKNRVLGQRLMYRTHSMAECCPTDDQAEVLLYKNIPRGHIIGIAVPTEEQARREKARLSFIKEVPKDIKWIIAPDLFNVSWSSMVREGDIPEEYYYRREGE
ncbi:DarT ssDNA thymidine ADP-ribosyltransferase family protein [Bacillus velezensis]